MKVSYRIEVWAYGTTDEWCVCRRLLALTMSKLAGSDSTDSASVVIVVIDELLVPLLQRSQSPSTNDHSRGPCA